MNGNLETYNQQPFVTTGFTELMDLTDFTWTEVERYPQGQYQGRLQFYGSISTESAVFIFGGAFGDEAVAAIMKFENMQWTHVGDLIRPRSLAAVRQIGNEFVVLSGRPNPSDFP